MKEELSDEEIYKIFITAFDQETERAQNDIVLYEDEAEFDDEESFTLFNKK